MVYVKNEPTLPEERIIIRKLPGPLTDIAHEKYVKVTTTELAKACAEIFANGLKITEDEPAYLEKETKLQAHCLLRYKYRTDRITASKLLL